MGNINKVELSGNVVRDAEVRPMNSGGSVISFSIAVNDRTKNQQTGEWEDRPNFVDCTMFDNNDKLGWIADNLRKGQKVFVAGQLRQDTWEDKDTGKKRSALKVIVRDIDAQWPTREQQGGAQQYQSQQYQQYQQPQYQQPQYQQPQQPYAQQHSPQQPVQPMQQQPTQQPPQQSQVYDSDIPF